MTSRFLNKYSTNDGFPHYTTSLIKGYEEEKNRFVTSMDWFYPKVNMNRSKYRMRPPATNR